MNLRRTAAVLLLGLAACKDTSSYYGEEFSNYYRGPAEESSSERVERREIVHWKANPREKKRIGFLYKYETLVKGSRTYRDSWYITDRLGKTRIGFITAEGKFHRFTEDGRIGEFVGEYKIATTGLKVFYGFPLTDNIDLEEVDPYK
jgi:hypothetical protein